MIYATTDSSYIYFTCPNCNRKRTWFVSFMNHNDHEGYSCPKCGVHVCPREIEIVSAFKLACIDVVNR